LTWRNGRGEDQAETVVTVRRTLADRLDDRGSGEFHFGYVHGHMDYRRATRDGEPAVERTWDGSDEMDPAQGRGCAVVKGDELYGMIFFDGGDDSEFVARNSTGPKRKAGK
jgi:hypothetical protein